MSAPASNNPRFGTVGIPVKAIANALTITKPPTGKFYQYDEIVRRRVAGDEREDKGLNPRRFEEVVHKMQTENVSRFKKRSAYDGNKILFSALDSLAGEYPVNASPTKRIDDPTNRGVYIVRLKSARNIDLRGDPLSCATLLQAFIRQGPKEAGETYNSRTLYTSEMAQSLDNAAFQLRRGIFQSVRASLSQSMFINLDLTSGIFYNPVRVSDWVLSFINSRDTRAIHTLSPEGQNKQDKTNWNKCLRALRGVLVTTTVPVGKANNKKIKGLYANVGDFEFMWEGHGPTTVFDFYLKAYGYQISNGGHTLGLDFSHPKRKILIPAECCQILPGQLFRKGVANITGRNVQAFNSPKPQDRRTQIEGFSQGPFLGYRSSPYIVGMGMEVANQLMVVDGRMLPEPPVQFGGGDRGIMPVRSGKWNAMKQTVHQVGNATTWAVVVFDSNIQYNAAQHFAQNLLGKCQDMGLTVRFLPAMNWCFQGNVMNPIATLEKARAPAENIRAELILCLIPNEAADLRRAIKLWGDARRGVVTQCIRAQNVGKNSGSDQFLRNVVLKINSKCGGLNAVPKPNVDLGRKANFPHAMVIGIDVTHPGPGISNRPSVVGVVSSYDAQLSKYRSFIKLQQPRLEIVEALQELVFNALDHYGNKMRTAPRVIYVYRDGVSEGEFDIVKEHEVAAIRNAWKQVWDERGLCKIFGMAKVPPCPLVFTVVGKRHHIRLFPGQQTHANARDNNGNMNAGFIVDRDITSRTEVDFYLQSHSSILGTSRSGHYTVLWNDQSLDLSVGLEKKHFRGPSPKPCIDIDTLQQLSFHLCYSYQRATRSVSIPAPVYYADLLCTRALFLLDETGQNHTYSDAGSGDLEMSHWEEILRPVHNNFEGFLFYM